MPLTLLLHKYANTATRPTSSTQRTMRWPTSSRSSISSRGGSLSARGGGRGALGPCAAEARAAGVCSRAPALLLGCPGATCMPEGDCSSCAGSVATDGSCSFSPVSSAAGSASLLTRLCRSSRSSFWMRSGSANHCHKRLPVQQRLLKQLSHTLTMAEAPNFSILKMKSS